MTSDAIPGYLREQPEGCTLAVRVQPGAKKTAITGVYGEGERAALKVAVQAAPLEGRANEALVSYLAELLGLPRSAVTLAPGQTSRSKVMIIQGRGAVQAQVKIQGAMRHWFS